MAEVARPRILYMEDDSGLARLLQKGLQRRGYTVDTAVDGEVGLLMLGAAPYDLLLVDYHMPHCGGLEVIRGLVKEGRLLPTIMVTGQGNEEIAVEALKLGASDYVVKDVEMKYLDLLPVIIERVRFQQQLIRERQEMVEGMRESEERYRKLVEISPEGIALHQGGAIAFINPSGARILGATGPEELIGRAILDLVPLDLSEVERERLRLLAEPGGQSPWQEGLFARCDGSSVEVEVSAASFPWQGKQMTQLIFHDITGRKQVEARLQQLALYDALTGLPNRSLFFDRLNQLLALARRNDYALALLFLDLDGFKQVNDTYGHGVGDELLRQVADRLARVMRKCDTIARMGGDEFIGLCGRIAEGDDAAVVAEKIIAELRHPYPVGERSCTIGASIGISIYPDDGEDSDTLLKKADLAMYRVKQGGQGGYLFFRDLGDESEPGSGNPDV